MIARELIHIQVIVDDETGIYDIDELDFGRSSFCMEWLEEDTANRSRLTQFFLWLAKACHRSEAPFGCQIVPDRSDLEGSVDDCKM